LVLRSNIMKILGFVLLHCLVAVNTTSGQGQVRRITLDEAVQLFNQNNLELEISRAAMRRVAGVARQTRAYPNPVASVTHESVSQSGLSFSETYYLLTQPIDWPWRYNSRRKAGSRRADAATAELKADSAQLVFELKRAYVEAAAAEAVWQVVDQVTTVIRDAEQNGTVRLTEGDISRFELKRVRIERARYEQLLMEVELELARLRRQLTALTVPADAGIELAPLGPLAGNPPSLSVEPLMSQALTYRGEIAAAIASVEAAHSTASVAKSARLPDPALTGGYKRQSDGFDGPFLGLAIPLPLWNWRGGDIAAAEARVEAAEAQEQLVRIHVTNDVKNAAQGYTALASRAAIIGDQLLSDVDDLLDVASLSYSEGELTLLEVLDAARAYSDAGVMRTRLKDSQLWLASAVGRGGIRVEPSEL
jgi:cobalt-zinc-cadmium efflux system outer membrane protein